MSNIPEKIAAAAIRINGEVWSLPPPVRHSHLIKVWAEAYWKDGKFARIGEHEQGFVTTLDRFVGREEAANIAYKQGQINEPKKGLFSEDLW